MELTLDQALQQGVAAHKEGKLQDAERLYRAILQAQPNHPDANHNLGVLAVAVGKPLEAIPLFKLALEANPQIEQFRISYVDALIKVERFNEAKRVLVEGEKSGISEEKLDALNQRLQVNRPNGNTTNVTGQMVSEKRKSLGERSSKEKKKEQGKSSAAGPAREQVDSLFARYQSGQLAEFEQLAVSMTKQFPAYQIGWKALGIALQQTGRLRESLLPMQKSVELEPQDAEAHSNLGITFKKLGRLDEAEASYRQAMALRPDFAEAYSNLGITLQELGRLDEAEAGHRQAIALKFDYAEAHTNLGVTLQDLGRLDEAEASHRQALDLKPDLAEARSNLGNTLHKLGNLEAAEASYRQAIALRSDYADAHYNLGNMLKELGRLDEAEATYKNAIALKPKYAEAHYNLGNTLHELRKLDDAEASYRAAIELKFENAKVHNNLGVILQKLGKLEEAEASHRHAIALSFSYAASHNNLGNTLQKLGRIEEAAASFKQAITLRLDYAEAHRNLAFVKRFSSRDEQFLQMQALYRSREISETGRCHICFALAKASEDIGDYATAFQFFAEGNALRKKNLIYDKELDKKLFHQLKTSYRSFGSNVIESEKPTQETTPVFIVGMPRSGTTLVEQIISSHPLVTGAGELPFVSQYGRSLAVEQSPVGSEALTTFSQQYRNALQNRSGGNPVVTDKMPQNFRYLGLIAAALPDAKIIHVKRNPAAVCWANFTSYFVNDSLGYCYDIDDVLHYHELYEDLIKYWHNALPGRIYDLGYERLTEHQEEETRKLLDYLGLKWDAACLSPQHNPRAVSTASSVQVRQRVYRKSSEKWKRYRPYLDGALDHFSANNN